MTDAHRGPHRRRGDLLAVLGVALAARLAVVAWAWSRFPPVEDGQKSHLIRKASSKQTKPTINRSSKRSSYAQDHSAVVVDGRHKRVWKACERCRMKKTKVCWASPPFHMITV